MYLQFIQQNQDLELECYRLNNLADTNRPKLHQAAIVIQACYRGYAVREELKKLNKNAKIIQSVYRGYRARRCYHNFVKATVKSMRENYYHKMATKIQSTYRGYLVRKNTHNFYARKRYLEMVKLQNAIVHEHLSNFKKAQDEEKQKRQSSKEKRQIIYEARKNHYLLSTRQVSGVYDPRVKNGIAREPMERMLRTVQPLEPFERKQKLPDIGAHLDVSQRDLNSRQKLMSVTSQPQGPFKRDRDAVIEQRFRDLNPTLRVSDKYEQSLLEARQQLRFDDMMKRIKGKPFLPVMRCAQEPYQNLLHTTSEYGHIDYGNKHFRAFESDTSTSSKNKSTEEQERFENVVSPIPFFDKYLAERERRLRKQTT